MPPFNHARRTRHSHTLILLAAFSIVIAPLASGADEKKGWFGFEIGAEIEGISLNPVLHAARIAKVLPSSPASAAGLTAGDLIVELEGLAIPGARAKDLKAATHKAVGESLHLKIKHGTDEPRAVTLVAIPKPEGR